MLKRIYFSSIALDKATAVGKNKLNENEPKKEDDLNLISSISNQINEKKETHQEFKSKELNDR